MASLTTYRAKRDFTQTREPRGKGRVAKGSRYVIQKHAARRLHYDLRLELDGVMLSWAVTKGPSLVPGDKRLAIHVEDHPIEYNTFEGTIPEGQYGGGTVMIWDRGHWTPEGDPHFGMKKGHLDFTLDGDKLKGRWHLVRMRKRPGERQEPWLLIKSDDEFARGTRDPDILDEEPDSVVSGRSIEQIAKKSDRVWHSNRAPNDQPDAKAKSSRRVTPQAARKGTRRKKTARSRSSRKKTAAKKSRKRPAIELARIEGARRKSLPDFVPPCLATLSARAPEGAQWLHEVKFDGYRMQGRLSAGRATLKTRTGLDWTSRFPTIADALQQLPAEQCILDGEIVSQGEGGVSDFSALQEDLKNGRHDRLVYYVFDLLYLDGFDLTGAAFVDRKAALGHFLSGIGSGLPVKLSEHFDTSGPVLLKHACQMHLEGIVSKLRDAPYHPGRVGDWLKTKCSASQEFVIAGYEPSTTRTRSIRALLLGYFDHGALRYAGRVGTGFTVKVEQDLRKKLDALGRSKATFDPLPEEERRRNIRWVEPKLVAEVDFRGWTHGDVLRQASFKGLREDKPAKEVTRETSQMKAAAAVQASVKKASSGHSQTGKRVLRAKANVSVAGVTLTHPDRVYWSDVDVTKKMLADYYAEVWDWIAPHLVNRPIALLRCPEGANSRNCFFQKHISAGLEGERLKSIPLRGEEPAIAVTDLPGLIALVQAGVLEIHTWGTTAAHIESCDRLVFDLDPGPGISFKDLVEGAREVRDRLKALDLQSFVKTTGGKGLHVVVPIAPTDWDKAKDFAHRIADEMEADNPQRYVATMAKKLRNHRIFVDYLRNGRGATAIAPYSTRARAGATVSAPVTWEELGSLDAANSYSVLTLPKRLARLRRDPWAKIGKIKQRLPSAPKRRGR